MARPHPWHDTKQKLPLFYLSYYALSFQCLTVTVLRPTHSLHFHPPILYYSRSNLCR